MPGAGVAGLNKLHCNVLTVNDALSYKAVIGPLGAWRKVCRVNHALRFGC